MIRNGEDPDEERNEIDAAKFGLTISYDKEEYERKLEKELIEIYRRRKLYGEDSD